jgi:hypothetical protein
MSRLKNEGKIAVAVPRWALAFHARHLLLLTTLSAVPVVQRFVTQVWGDRIPGTVSLASEVLTWTARLALVVIVVRLAITADPAVPGTGTRWHNAKAFVRSHWPSLLLQYGLLMLATAVFKVVPDLALAGLAPDDEVHIYRGWLLAVKNLTVIPFTVIWLVGAVRQAIMFDGVQPPLTTRRLTQAST